MPYSEQTPAERLGTLGREASSLGRQTLAEIIDLAGIDFRDTTLVQAVQRCDVMLKLTFSEAQFNIANHLGSDTRAPYAQFEVIDHQSSPKDDRLDAAMYVWKN